MPANGRRDLIRRLKVNDTVLGVTFEVTVLFGSMYLQFNAYTTMKF